MKENRVLPDIEACKEKFKTIFKNISPEVLNLLNCSENIHFFKKNAVIYSEGARMKGCYFVYEGIVKIYQTGNEGKEQIIKFEKEGNIFGFRSVILKEAACTSVETLTDAVLCFIPGNTLLQLLKENSDFAYELMQIACKELGESNRNIKNIAQKSVKKRLAEILITLANDFGIEPDGQLKLNISREDLGNFAGTATETIIRLLSEYKTEGLVEAKGRKIKLLDIEKLKRNAGD
ncbi:Crp/Fnr family transcriptional regulator [Porphyromonadaceae bacterium OttesenSCG-928-L07]|nr:Crp/Fnr family transcriptional regulator [Porphyromonadaceae bacterium OttesenSCG-928-L07]MDL2330777.1 Crp/Fnr family transcriptional regulator [Odoribacter sp. OttesenSCG-928-A06]